MENGRKKNMTERLMRKEKWRRAAASLEPALQQSVNQVTFSDMIIPRALHERRG